MDLSACPYLNQDYAPHPVSDLETPCVVADLSKVIKNAEKLLKIAGERGLKLRPHAKTHKTLGMAWIQTNGTKRGLVVSTLAEAEFYQKAGFDDILYSVPISKDKVARAAALLHKLESFQLLADNIDIISQLSSFPTSKPWPVWIKLDCGNHRAGLVPNDVVAIELAKAITASPNCTLAGVYVHAGQSYYSRGVEEIKQVAKTEKEAVSAFIDRLSSHSITCANVAIGSTPTCSYPADDLVGVTEMHPGNYIVYDIQQAIIGSCSREEIGMVVVTRIVGVYPDRHHLLLDAGFTALSNQGADIGYGEIEGHPEMRIVGLTQELAKVQAAPGHTLDFNNIKLGDILRILPFHSCVISCLTPSIYISNKDGLIIDEWATAPRR